MKTILTKRKQCNELAGKGWELSRIARVLDISERQVLRSVLFVARDEKEGRTYKRVRKPQPVRV